LSKALSGGCHAQCFPARRVDKYQAQCVGERGDLARRNQKALAAIDDGFGNSSDRGCDDGLARYHCLQDRHRQPFPERWHHEDVRERKHIWDVVPIEHDPDALAKSLLANGFE
jgi:hypothetical protein